MGMIMTSGIWAAISSKALAFSTAFPFQAQSTHVHDVRNLGGDLQHGLGLFNGMLVPGPEYQRSWEDRGVGAGQHLAGHLFDDLVLILLQQPIVEPLPWVRQRDPQL